MRSIATLAAAAAALGLVAGPVGSAQADDSAQDTINQLR